MALTRDQTVALARSQIGIKEYPPGSNRVIYSLWYGFVAAWCAMFVSWIMWKAGIGWYRFASTAASVAAARRDGRSIPISQALPGDVMVHLYSSTLGHTGIATTPGGTSTVEGNTDGGGSRTGGQVLEHQRPADYWHYCIRLDYPDVAPTPTPAPQPIPVPTKPSWEDDVPKPKDYTSACIDPVTGGMFRQTAEGGVDGINGAPAVIGRTYKDYPAAGGNVRYFTAIVPNGQGKYIQIANDGATYNEKDWPR